jgi:hypothetical protein
MSLFELLYLPSFDPLLFSAGGSDIVVAWYLPTGIVAADCLGAYRFKGAASEAVSLVNLVTPGTYDLTKGGSPTWNISTGWTFNGSNNYLETGLDPANTWTALCQYTNAVTNEGALFGVDTVDYIYFFFMPILVTNHCYANCVDNRVFVSGNKTAGNACLTYNQGYFDGLADGDPLGTDGFSSTGSTIALGCAKQGTSKVNYSSVKIQAFAIYNKTLTAAQILSVATAMAAF